jgi:hypothetical protein
MALINFKIRLQTILISQITHFQMILELKNAFKHVPDLGVDATGSASA